MNFLQNFIKNIKKANKIAIFTHKDSDHDTICSAVALKEIIKQMGKKSVIFVDKKPSESILKFVPKEKFLTTTDEKFDVAICVDCSSIKRLSDDNLKIFSSAKETFNIDHHQDNTFFANFNHVQKGWSSCCEVLYSLFKDVIKLNKYLASTLYTGLFMDCGAFTYSSTTDTTHKCASELLKFSPKIKEQFFACFGVLGQEEFLITQRAFQSVKFFLSNQVAVSVLTTKDFQECGVPREKGKFIVSYLQNVAGVKISINISEDGKNEWRISLRTTNDKVDLSNIAHRFHGGGHKRASGCTLKGDIKKVINALISECKKELEK